MSDEIVVVLVTVPSEEVGEKLARHLVEKHLAACVNLLPGVRSFFTWQGQFTQEHEGLLMIKTRQELFETQLIPAILALHPYQTPEILVLPVACGLPAYLRWVLEETRST